MDRALPLLQEDGRRAQRAAGFVHETRFWPDFCGIGSCEPSAASTHEGLTCWFPHALLSCSKAVTPDHRSWVRTPAGSGGGAATAGGRREAVVRPDCGRDADSGRGGGRRGGTRGRRWCRDVPSPPSAPSTPTTAGPARGGPPPRAAVRSPARAPDCPSAVPHSLRRSRRERPDGSRRGDCREQPHRLRGGVMRFAAPSASVRPAACARARGEGCGGFAVRRPHGDRSRPAVSGRRLRSPRCRGRGCRLRQPMRL